MLKKLSHGKKNMGVTGVVCVAYDFPFQFNVDVLFARGAL